MASTYRRMDNDKIVNIFQALTQIVLIIQQVSSYTYAIITLYLCSIAIATDDGDSSNGKIVGIIVSLIALALIILVLALTCYFQ